MLVLTRRITPTHRETDIFITMPNGDVVKVALVQIKGGQVRLGFNAPEGYYIDRAEVYEKNKAERAQNLVNPGQCVLTF